MRLSTIKLFVITFIILSVLFSCKKRDSSTSQQQTNIANQWTFRDTVYTGSTANSNSGCLSSCFSNITSEDIHHDNCDLEFFTLKLPSKSGVYSIIDGTTSGDSTQCNLYIENSSANGLPPYEHFKSTNGSGKTVTVSVDKGKITCTFSNVPMVQDQNFGQGNANGTLSGTLVYIYQ